MSVTRETILRAAELARIALREDEADELIYDVRRILDYVAKLPDSSEAIPLGDVRRGVLREDEVREGLTHEEALRNAPAKRGGFIQVPAFLPKER